MFKIIFNNIVISKTYKLMKYWKLTFFFFVKRELVQGTRKREKGKGKKTEVRRQKDSRRQTGRSQKTED